MLNHWIHLTPQRAVINGKTLDTKGLEGGTLLTTLYREYVNDYPKYFKMDPLSRTGFVASELLLDAEAGSHAERTYEPCSDRAVVLFNASASLSDDRLYQETIADRSNFYPSPAVFVYTLANIVTGEIAIRNHYHGETSFLVLPRLDAKLMASTLCAGFLDTQTRHILGGWLECREADRFEALLFIVEAGTSPDALAQDIETIQSI